MQEGWLDRPVDLLADDRVAHLGHVDADLVGPPGLEPAGEQAGDRAEPLDDLEVGHRPLPLAVEPGDASTEVAPVGDQGLVDRARLAPGRPFDDGQVLPLDVVLAEQLLERPDRLGRAGQGEGAGGVLVEPVDHPEERLAAAVAEREVARRPGDQRVALAVGGRLGEQAGGLVDDQDVRVFVENLEPAGDLPGLGPIGEELDRRVDRDLPAGLVAALAVEVDPAVPHGLLGGPAREPEPIGHQLVESDR